MDYFVYLNNERKGPYSLEELADKYITEDILVWHEGLSDWKRAGELDELKEVVKQMPPDPPRFKFIKNWFTESVAITAISALLSYLPMFQFCLVALPFGGIAIFKALKVQEFQRKGQPDMARHFATEARKWTLWCLFATIVAVIFAIIGLVLLFLLGFFLWEHTFPF